MREAGPRWVCGAGKSGVRGCERRGDCPRGEEGTVPEKSVPEKSEEVR